MAGSMAGDNTKIKIRCFALQDETEKKNRVLEDAPVRFRVLVTTYLNSDAADHPIVLGGGPREMGFVSTLRHFLIPAQDIPALISRELSLVGNPHSGLVDRWMEKISSATALAAQQAHRFGVGFAMDVCFLVFCPEEVVRRTLGELGTAKYSRDSGFREETCAICWEDFEPGTEVATMVGCSHTFHQPCLLQWLVLKPLCPLCRKTSSTPPEDDRRA